jgi:hypothetical protein
VVLSAPAGRLTGGGRFTQDAGRRDHFEDWSRAVTAEWDFDVPAGDYAVDVIYACDGHNAGTSFAVTVGATRLAGTVADTGGWSGYSTQRVGAVRLGAGLQTAAVAASPRPGGGEIAWDYHALVLTPAGGAGTPAGAGR